MQPVPALRTAPSCPVATPDDPVAAHAAKLLGIARRIVASDDLADDALQEARVSLWLRGERPPNTEAWLVRTVVNRSLHTHRSVRRRRNHEACACALRRYERGAESPARALERQEEHELVHRALDALEQTHREILVLREFQGRDYVWISRALGVPVGTVRSRLSRARAALRGHVDVLFAAAERRSPRTE